MTRCALISVLLLSVVLALAVQHTKAARWSAAAARRYVLQQESNDESGRWPQREDLPMREIKRSEPEFRVCGAKLIGAAIKICNGCFGFMGKQRTLRKRSPSGRTVTDRCCKDKCTESWIKENLCSDSC